MDTCTVSFRIIMLCDIHNYNHLMLQFLYVDALKDTMTLEGFTAKVCVCVFVCGGGWVGMCVCVWVCACVWVGGWVSGWVGVDHSRISWIVIIFWLAFFPCYSQSAIWIWCCVLSLSIAATGVPNSHTLSSGLTSSPHLTCQSDSISIQYLASRKNMLLTLDIADQCTLPQFKADFNVEWYACLLWYCR